MAIEINGDTGISGVNGSATTPAIQGTDTNTGLSFGTDEVNIVTGGSTRATVDSNGDFSVNTDAIFVDASADRVGVGTNAPDSPVHIKGTAQMFPRVETTSSTNDAGWKIKNGEREWSTFVNGSDGAYRIYDETASSERLRIANDGRLLYGTTSVLADGRISLKGDFGTNRGVVMETNQSSADMVRFQTSSGHAGTINSSGTSTTYTTSSDYRLKENVVPLTNAISRIQQIPVHRFNFIADPTKTVDGFLAHEAQAVVPEAVTGTQDEVEVWKEHEELPDGVSVGDNKLDEDGNTIPVYQGIDQSKLVPLLTAALQEALAKIETLETRLTALEGGTN